MSSFQNPSWLMEKYPIRLSHLLGISTIHHGKSYYITNPKKERTTEDFEYCSDYDTSCIRTYTIIYIYIYRCIYEMIYYNDIYYYDMFCRILYHRRYASLIYYTLKNIVHSTLHITYHSHIL